MKWCVENDEDSEINDSADEDCSESKNWINYD